jgi:E3 ubiquitin-protein ligase BAH
MLFLSRALQYLMELTGYAVRLACDHLYCIHCVIHLQRKNSKECPLCRKETVMNADSYSINYELLRFLEAFFPTESKRKQRENEKAVAKERFGMLKYSPTY